MSDKICGIYKIVNKLDGKIYVGQSGNVHKRMNDVHTECRYLIYAIEKHGKENFESFVIEYCDKPQLNDREKYWIKELHSHVSENGYNISWGGLNPMEGRKHTEESKKKISNAVKGENHPLWGTHHSEESKRKNRESQLGEKNHNFGKPNTEEQKRKSSEAQSGEKNHCFGKFGPENPKFGTKSKNAKSKYFGVSFHKRGKYEYWTANIKIDRKQKWIGQSKTEMGAAILYNDFVIQNNLPYPLNNL